MIKIENLTYRYSSKSPFILKELNLEIKKGEFVALIGENGAGKTTLLKQLNGMNKPTSGTVLINGKDTKSSKTSEMAKHIGYLFQNPDHQIFCDSVYEEIAFGLKNQDKLASQTNETKQKVNDIAELLNLTHLLKENPFNLSKGEKQRVALASILALETEILVLDEPTTGQDYKECMEIMEIVRTLNEKGTTVIVVSHDMEIVQDFAKRVVILYNGNILEDGITKEIFLNEKSLMLAGIKPPQLFQLMIKLEDDFEGADTAEAMVEVMKGRRQL